MRKKCFCMNRYNEGGGATPPEELTPRTVHGQFLGRLQIYPTVDSMLDAV